MPGDKIFCVAQVFPNQGHRGFTFIEEDDLERAIAKARRWGSTTTAGLARDLRIQAWRAETQVFEEVRRTPSADLPD